MLQLLDVRPGQRVLEIGTGSGYGTALLAELTGPEGRVTSIELNHELAERAQAALETLGYHGASVLAGDGWYGMGHRAPYDRILLGAGSHDVSPYWFDQLRERGILVVPLWLGAGIYVALPLRKAGDTLHGAHGRPTFLTPLFGAANAPPAHTHVNAGVVARSLRSSRSAFQTLRRLMDEDPWEVEIAPPQRGWFSRLVLDKTGAIAVYERGWVRALGIFEPRTPGLALLSGTKVSGYGRPETLHGFLSWIASARPLDLRKIRVDAHPSSSPRPTPRATWTLRRPHFTFVVRESGGNSTRPANAVRLREARVPQ
jgi:SAM-dependent methyltransferase